MRRVLLAASSAALLALGSALPSSGQLSCSYGNLDFSPLTAGGGYISSSDYALFNYYFQPCGSLARSTGEGVPAACMPQSGSGSGSSIDPNWAATTLCRTQNFDTGVSMADWSAAGHVTWSALEGNDDSDGHEGTGGALLSFQSALANCTGDDPAAPAQVFTASVAFVCDTSGAYRLHGPLDLMDYGACDVKLSMRTWLACEPGTAIATPPAATAAAAEATEADALVNLVQPKAIGGRRRHHMHRKLSQQQQP
jgi:hypothetical protein